MVEQIHKTIFKDDEHFFKEVKSKRAFQDSYDYLRDRYNLKSSYSSFEKNCLNKGFFHDDDDFDLIVMSVLVGMGRIDDAYTEANVQSDNYINELENELERLTDELGEEITKDKVIDYKEFIKTTEWKSSKKHHVIKLTLKEKAGFVLQAIKEAFYKTFK
jgi:hypothetical protein